MGNYRNKKYNDYEIQEDYVIMYTNRKEMFLIDLEDFYRVKKYCWWMDNRGYLRAKIDGQSIGLHQYLMNCSKGEIVDHKITENKWDNRKANLRVGTQQKNCMNRKISSCNSSGVTGVSFDKSKNKWVARIGIDYKKINLGAFDNKDDAIKVRKEAEEKYFGEWSYDKSRELSNVGGII